MKNYKTILAALAITGIPYASMAQLEMSKGDASLKVDVGGALSYDDETGDTTLDDATFKIDAQITEHLGAFFEQGYVKEKLEDLDIDEMDVRQAYVSVQSTGEIILKLDVGRQNMAFGEQNSVNAYRDSSVAESLQERFRAAQGATITWDRSDANYEGVLGALSDLAQKIQVSYIDKGQDDSGIPDETYTAKVSGSVMGMADTSVSVLQGDEDDDQGYEISARLHLDKSMAKVSDNEMLQSALSQSSIGITYTNLEFAGVEEEINRISAVKAWDGNHGTYSLGLEHEERDIDGSNISETNTVSAKFRPSNSRFMFGIQFQKDEKNDDDAVAATVEYNLD